MLISISSGWCLFLTIFLFFFFFVVAQVEHSATNSQIKSSFRKLSMVYHPDKNDGDDTEFVKLRDAFDSIGDSKKRRFYDRYGPDYLDCTHCVTLEDFDQYFMIINIVYYIIAFVVTYLSTNDHDRNYLRLPFLFLLLCMGVCEYVGIHSSNGMHPLSDYLFNKPLFENMSILRRAYFTVLIVMSVASSMWWSASDMGGSVEQRLNRIEKNQLNMIEGMKFMIAAQEKLFMCFEDNELRPVILRKLAERQTIMSHPEVQALVTKILEDANNQTSQAPEKEESGFGAETVEPKSPGAA